MMKMYSVSPCHAEFFYLKMLLLHISDLAFFNHLETARGEVFLNFQRGAYFVESS